MFYCGRNPPPWLCCCSVFILVLLTDLEEMESFSINFLKDKKYLHLWGIDSYWSAS